MLPSHRAWRWLLWACAAVFLIGLTRYAGYLLDDSFISFRYARNLVEGHGLVFNPGERVEGYTNLLFVLISAVFIGAGIPPVTGASVVAIASALAALAAAGALVREVMEASGADLDASRRASVVAAGLLLVTEGFAYWSLAGMETMLFTALLALAVLQLLREERRGRGHASAALFLLLALTRPEGALAAAVALGSAAILAWRRQAATALPHPGGGDAAGATGGAGDNLQESSISAPGASRDAAAARQSRGSDALEDRAQPPASPPPSWSRPEPLRRLALTAGLTAAGIVALFLWRVAYYGAWLPNTFHAKVTGGAGERITGLRYLGQWAASSPVAALSLAAPLILLSPAARRRLGRGSPLWILWALVAAFALVTIGVGGDSMPFHRFPVHVLPLACVVAAAAGQRLLGARRWPPRAAAALAVAAVAVQAGASRATEQVLRAFVAHRTAVVGLRAGDWFGDRLPDGALMAVNTAGALPWASRLPTLDMLGLADPVIARRPVFVDSPGWAGHRRGWGDYVLSRRPAAILWYNTAGSPRPHYLGDRELAESPWFRFFYRHRVHHLPVRSGRGKGAAPLPRGPGEARGGGGAPGEGSSPPPGGPGASDKGPRAMADAGPAIARFAGRPVGFDASGAMAAPELGLTASFHDGVIPWTAFREGPVTIHWFEPDPRDVGLWAVRERAGARIDPFIDAVTGIWRGRKARRPPPGPGVEAERDQVEALCEEARVKAEAGDLEAARRILSRAQAANARARSPLVYHYMANVAVMSGEPFVALAAQKEALRLAPDSRLHAENLKRLLTLPWEELSAPRAPGAAQSGS